MTKILPLQSTQGTIQPVQGWDSLIQQLDTVNRKIQVTFDHFMSGYAWDEFREVTQSIEQMELLVSNTLPPLWKVWKSIFCFIPNTQSYAIWSKSVSMRQLFGSLRKEIKQNIKARVICELNSGTVQEKTLEIMRCFLKIVPTASIYRYLGTAYQKNGVDPQKAFDCAFYYKKSEKNLLPLLRSLLQNKEINKASALVRDYRWLLKSCEAKLVEIEVLCRTGEFPKAILLCWEGINGEYGLQRDPFVHKLVDTFILQSENLTPEVLENSLREILSCFANKSSYAHSVEQSDHLLLVAFDAFDYILKNSERGVDLFKSLLAFPTFEQRHIQLFIRFVQEKVEVLTQQKGQQNHLPYIGRLQKVLLPAIAFFNEHREYSSDIFSPAKELARFYNQLSALKSEYTLGL